MTDDVRHFLGVFAAESPDDASVEMVRELGGDQYRRYVEDVLTVLACWSDYRQFTMVRHAYVEYAGLLQSYETMLSRPMRLDEVLRDDVAHGINRRLRGFFSEFRVFLDYTQTKLKRRYGGDSGQLRAFKDACARQFDGNFAYRFVYGLRNYALHVNLPLNAMSLVSRKGRFDPEDSSTHNQLRIEVDGDRLLREFDWRKDVRLGLKALPSTFALNPYIDEAMDCLEKIHLELFRAKLPVEKRAAECLLDMAGSVDIPGTPCILHFGGSGEPMVNSDILQTEFQGESSGGEHNPDDMHIGWIPVEVADAVIKLPGAEELSRYEYIDWQIADAVPGDASVPG